MNPPIDSLFFYLKHQQNQPRICTAIPPRDILPAETIACIFFQNKTSLQHGVFDHEFRVDLVSPVADGIHDDKLANLVVVGLVVRV